MVKLICMGFDGEYQTERPEFKTIEEAWEYSNNLGSKWYFYPFHFVVSNSCKTVVSPPDLVIWAKGKRIKSVSKIFNIQSKFDRCQGMTSEEFALSIWGR